LLAEENHSIIKPPQRIVNSSVELAVFATIYAQGNLKYD
jgi:hypothetical protein